MAANEIKFEMREGTGKSVTRKLRKSGKIPAVIYGRGEESFPITVDGEEFKVAINRLRGKLLLTDLVSDKGERFSAAIKAIQRHPLTDEFLNIDFQKVHPGEILHVSIPLIITGTPVGLKMGGVLEHVRYAVDVRGPVASLPLHIGIDINNLNIGDAIRVQDLKFGEGVEVLNLPQTLIVAVIHPRKIKEVEVTPTAAAVEGETPVVEEEPKPAEEEKKDKKDKKEKKE